MQGLRPYVQDENALAGLHRPAALKAGLGGGDAVAGLAARKGGATPAFPRKALGNITNRGADAENAPPGKTPMGAGPAPARRALGDITNSAAPAGSRAQQLKPQGAGPASQQALQPPAAVGGAATGPADRAELLAQGGVERCFGRGWEQLEADRRAREEAEIGRRLAALASFPPARALPNFFPLWSATQQQALQKDALPPLPASPIARRPASPAGLSMPDTSDLSLPDLSLPDIDDAF